MIKAWNRLGSIYTARHTARHATRRGFRSRFVSCIGLVLVASGVAALGCSDGISPPAPLSNDPYVALRFNTNVATMSTVAPYNVLQLTATPYTSSGARLTTTAAVVYSTIDTAVTLTSSGTVTARYATSVPAVVVASLQDSASNVTHVDTMYITVTTTVPTTPLASLALVRQPGDSKLAVATQSLWRLFPIDTLHVTATGADATDLRSRVILRFRSSDTSVARVDPVSGFVQGLQPGTVTIRVGTTYYGVTKQDSVQLTIGNPVVVAVRAYPVVSPTVAGQYLRIYDPNTITVGVGGTVVFYAGVASDPSPTPLSWDVVFDSPDEAQASTIPPVILGSLGGNTGIGDIATTPPALLSGGAALNPACVSLLACLGATRSFPHAGTYHYHSALYGTSGTIVVAP